MSTTVALVVEDDPVILKLLTVNFELEGYEVRTATNGAEALERVREARSDVIVRHIMVPVMSGIDLVSAVVGDPDLLDAP